MKRKLNYKIALLVLGLIGLLQSAKALNNLALPDTCDAITLIDGKIIYCTVTGVLNNKVYYKNCTKEFGIPRGISADSVFMISHPNGTYQLMHETPESAAKKGVRSYDGLAGKFCISTGVALGIRTAVMSGGGFFSVEPNPDWDAIDENYTTYTAGPVYTTAFDYNISGYASMGLAYAFQNFYGTLSSQQATGNEILTRSNAALRVLLHLKHLSNDFDSYFGVRAGVLYWTDKMPLNNPAFPYYPNYPYFPEPYAVAASFQVLYGFRIYSDNNIGIGGEIGLGSPFLAQFSVCYRISAEWKHKDSTKTIRYSGYTAFMEGTSTPRGGYGVNGSGGQIGTGYLGEGGFANQGMCYSLSACVPLIPHVGLAGMASYANNTMTMTSSDSYRLFSLLPGIYATIGIGVFSFDARIYYGYMAATSPDVLYYQQLSSYTNSTYNDLQPAHAGTAAFDAGIGIRASLNHSRMALILNADYLSANPIFNCTYYLANNQFGPAGQQQYTTSTISVHIPVQLINVSLGVAYQFGK